MIRDHKLWTWHLAAGILIFFLLGLHMAIMHLDALLGLFSPAGGHPIDWENVAARNQSLFFMVTYVLLLAAALFHGFYGLRNILFELGPSATLKKSLSWALILVGLSLFIVGGWAAWASYQSAATV
jgi:succinate dehydrogenase / fumarate reductase membrane anchor subunit